MGTFASRSAVNAGNSTHLAAIEVATKIRKVASEMMEVAEADLELKDGAVNVKGAPGMRKTFREIANLAVGMYGFSMPADRAHGSTIVKVSWASQTGRPATLPWPRTWAARPVCSSAC